MPRYIDADALIDDIRKHSESYFADDFAHEWVDKQPSADVPQWIPCSERLPDRYGKTLVTCGNGVWASVMIAVYSNIMGISKPCFWIGNVGRNDFENITDQVTAWIPLPKPYKDGEQNV